MGLRLQVLSEAEKHLGIRDDPGEKQRSQVREEEAKETNRTGSCSGYLFRVRVHTLVFLFLSVTIFH